MCSPQWLSSGRGCFGYVTGPVLVHSFWPSLAAPAGQTSAHLPQATHFSASTCARYAEADIFGVLNSWLVLSAKQEPSAQLQMAKILSSPSMFVIWWT